MCLYGNWTWIEGSLQCILLCLVDCHALPMKLHDHSQQDHSSLEGGLPKQYISHQRGLHPVIILWAVTSITIVCGKNGVLACQAQC